MIIIKEYSLQSLNREIDPQNNPARLDTQKTFAAMHSSEFDSLINHLQSSIREYISVGVQLSPSYKKLFCPYFQSTGYCGRTACVWAHCIAVNHAAMLLAHPDFNSKYCSTPKAECRSHDASPEFAHEGDLMQVLDGRIGRRWMIASKTDVVSALNDIIDPRAGNPARLRFQIVIAANQSDEFNHMISPLQDSISASMYTGAPLPPDFKKKFCPAFLSRGSCAVRDCVQAHNLVVNYAAQMLSRPDIKSKYCPVPKDECVHNDEENPEFAHIEELMQVPDLGMYGKKWIIATPRKIEQEKVKALQREAELDFSAKFCSTNLVSQDRITGLRGAQVPVVVSNSDTWNTSFVTAGIESDDASRLEILWNRSPSTAASPATVVIESDDSDSLLSSIWKTSSSTAESLAASETQLAEVSETEIELDDANRLLASPSPFSSSSSSSSSLSRPGSTIRMENENTSPVPYDGSRDGQSDPTVAASSST